MEAGGVGRKSDLFAFLLVVGTEAHRGKVIGQSSGRTTPRGAGPLVSRLCAQ